MQYCTPHSRGNPGAGNLIEACQTALSPESLPGFVDWLTTASKISAAGHPPNDFDHPVPRQLPVRPRRQLWRFPLIPLIISLPFRGHTQISRMYCTLQSGSSSDIWKNAPPAEHPAIIAQCQPLYKNKLLQRDLLRYFTRFLNAFFTVFIAKCTRTISTNCSCLKRVFRKKQGTFTARPAVFSNRAPQSGNPPFGRAAR